jgi:hypothetical protein
LGAAYQPLGRDRILHGNAVRELTKEKFDQLYPNPPPLPPTAFRSEFVRRRDKELLGELTPKQRRLVESLLADYPALPLAKALAMLKDGGM